MNIKDIKTLRKEIITNTSVIAKTALVILYAVLEGTDTEHIKLACNISYDQNIDDTIDRIARIIDYIILHPDDADTVTMAAMTADVIGNALQQLPATEYALIQPHADEITKMARTVIVQYLAIPGKPRYITYQQAHRRVENAFAKINDNPRLKDSKAATIVGLLVELAARGPRAPSVQWSALVCDAYQIAEHYANGKGSR